MTDCALAPKAKVISSVTSRVRRRRGEYALWVVWWACRVDAVLRCVVAIVFIRYDFSFLFLSLRTRSRELSCKDSGKLGDCKRKTLFCGLSPVDVRKHNAKVRHLFWALRLNAKFCKVLQSSCKRARCKLTCNLSARCSRTKGA